MWEGKGGNGVVAIVVPGNAHKLLSFTLLPFALSVALPITLLPFALSFVLLSVTLLPFTLSVALPYPCSAFLLCKNEEKKNKDSLR